MIYFIKIVCFMVLCSNLGLGQELRLETVFANCKRGSPNFDICIRDALNDLRPYFKTGLPEYNISPFDPFYADEVVQKRGGLGFNYVLKLKNVTESGWTVSRVTAFKSDFQNNKVVYTQFFPDKRLKGLYEFSGNILGSKINLKGDWSLGLFDFVQTTTVTRKPRISNGIAVYDTPLKVNVNIQSSNKLELHISNLLGGLKVAESMLDRLINFAWPPGFLLLRPIINDLVSTAFTKIFDDNFRNFPFDQIIT